MTLGAEIDPETRPLLEWLLRAYPDTPKTRAKQWITSGRVKVHGVTVRKPHQLLPDPAAALELLHRDAVNLDLGAGWLIHPRVSLLYLDSALAVLNKGAGLLSVPALNSALSALSILADFLAGKLKPRGNPSRTLPAAFRALKPLPVHRLDQYTTGVFCAAVNPAARAHLIAQVRAHTMKREYVAFVEGRSSAQKGTWAHWLELSQKDTRQHVVDQQHARNRPAEAREAITHFQVLAEYPVAGGMGFVTKLHLTLETGLKHQIRIQAAQAGLPLVGDRTYHPGARPHERPDALVVFPRQALHADRLTLEHPDKPGVRMTWQAELPPDLLALEQNLHRQLGSR